MSQHETEPDTTVPASEAPPTRLSRRKFLQVGGVSGAAAALAACAQAPTPPPAAEAPPATAAAPAPTTAPAPTAVPATVAASEAPATVAAAAQTSDLLPYPRIRIAGIGDLADGAFSTAYPDDASPVQVLKLGTRTAGGVGPDEDIVAYSGLCTHMGCPVLYVPEAKIFQCPCHYSHFDVEQDAMLINGPATQHLPRLTLEVDGEDIYAVGMHGLIYGRPHNLSLT